MKGRIAVLEARVASLEARLAALEDGPLAALEDWPRIKLWDNDFGLIGEVHACADDRREDRLRRWVHRKLAECGPMTAGALRKAATSKNRPWIQAAIDGLADDGLIEMTGDGWDLAWQDAGA